MTKDCQAPGVSPEEALAALERRAGSLRTNLAALDRELRDEGGPLRLPSADLAKT